MAELQEGHHRRGEALRSPRSSPYWSSCFRPGTLSVLKYPADADHFPQIHGCPLIVETKSKCYSCVVVTHPWGNGQQYKRILGAQDIGLWSYMILCRSPVPAPLLAVLSWSMTVL